MKKRGFTLMELLGVIIVIAIIAIIAIPQALKIVENSRQGSFKESMAGLLSSADLYYTDYAGKKMQLDLSDPSVTEMLDYKGKVPKGGTLYIDQDASMALQAYNDKYCARKSYASPVVSVEKGSCDKENYWRYSSDNLKSAKGDYPKVFAGVTIDYDPATQIFTYNGTTTAKTAMYSEFYIPEVAPVLKSSYTITTVYISGQGPTTSQYACAGLDLGLLNSAGTGFGNIATRQYVETALRDKTLSSTKTLDYVTTNPNHGYKLFLYFRDEGIVFKDYKFKVMLNPGSNKEWVENLFVKE